MIYFRYLAPFIIALTLFSEITQASVISFSELTKTERKQYLALTNWKRYIRTIKAGGDRKREVFYRSLKEGNHFKNPGQEFEDNLNQFLNRENYKCEDLARYEFFVDITGINIHESVKCDNYFSTFVNLYSGFKEISFYKNRIIKLSYLMASNGESAMSRFGHSMFYIRACKEDIENCPLKKQTEFIIGIAADVDDFSPGLLKGIFGGYATKLDFMTLAQVKQKYNYDEYRDLEQYDLNISERDKLRFIAHATKLYVDKNMGRYKFFSSNCATESLKILKASIDKEKLVGNALTPKGLLKDLKRDGIIAKTPNRFFKEKSGLVANHLGNIGFASIEEYYASSVEERFLLAKERAKANLSLIKNSYIFLEKMALVKLQDDMMKAASNFKDKKKQKKFLLLASSYKDWLAQNAQRARLGMSPLANTVTKQMNEFYQNNFNDVISEITLIGHYMKIAKNDFK